MFSYGHNSFDKPAKTYIDPLSADPGYSLVDLPGEMANRVRWWKESREKSLGIMMIYNNEQNTTLKM